MDALAAYASDASPSPSPSPSPPPKKLRLPAPPASLLPPVHTDVPALHQGRTRTRAHVDGDFATSIFIPVPPDALPTILSGYTHAEAEAETETRVHRCEDVHVSISHVIYIRAHQRTTLRTALHNIARSSPPFEASFARTTTLLNSTHTRRFLALEVGAGHAALARLAEDIAAALRAAGLGVRGAGYHAQPRFHASVLWGLVPGAGDELEARVGAAEGRWMVREVCVRIGRDVRAYTLGGT